MSQALSSSTNSRGPEHARVPCSHKAPGWPWLPGASFGMCARQNGDVWACAYATFFFEDKRISDRAEGVPGRGRPRRARLSVATRVPATHGRAEAGHARTERECRVARGDAAACLRGLSADRIREGRALALRRLSPRETPPGRVHQRSYAAPFSYDVTVNLDAFDSGRMLRDMPLIKLMSMKSAPAVDGLRPRGSSHTVGGAEKTEGLPETFLGGPVLRLRHRVSTDADAVTGRLTRGRRTGRNQLLGLEFFESFFPKSSRTCIGGP